MTLSAIKDGFFRTASQLYQKVGSIRLTSLVGALALGALGIYVQSYQPRPNSLATLPYEGRTPHPGLFCFDNSELCYKMNRVFQARYRGDEAIIKEALPEMMSNQGFLEEIEGLPYDGSYKVEIRDPKSHQRVEVSVLANSFRTRNLVPTIEYVHALCNQVVLLKPEEIVLALIRGNELLVQNSGAKSGKLREQNLFVFRGDENSNQEIFSEHLINRKRKDKVFASIYRKIKREDFVFTEEEKKALQEYCYIPPSPREIPDLMNQFAKEFKEGLEKLRIDNDFDVVKFAAYIHCKLGEIHPFEDGNGGLARLLMNEILKMGGYQPPVIFSDKEYTDAVEKGPEFFASFLREALLWTQKEFPLDPCLPKVTCV